jgi:hypothetical protein
MYCEQKQYKFNKEELELQAESFFNHYEGTGWLAGKQKIKFWPATARKWVVQTIINKKFKNTQVKDNTSDDKQKYMPPSSTLSLRRQLKERLKMNG